MEKSLVDLPASYVRVECQYDTIFLISKPSMLDIWSKIIQPPQTATLATTFQTFIIKDQQCLRKGIIQDSKLSGTPKIKTSSTYCKLNRQGSHGDRKAGRLK